MHIFIKDTVKGWIGVLYNLAAIYAIANLTYFLKSYNVFIQAITFIILFTLIWFGAYKTFIYNFTLDRKEIKKNGQYLKGLLFEQVEGLKKLEVLLWVAGLMGCMAISHEQLMLALVFFYPVGLLVSFGVAHFFPRWGIYT